ncbi:rod shape-determining protein RodA [Anaerococcus sp. mt242]|uniref:rod shape-determining protein RodA n=1 Tax=Anaerococcus sp. mt242 TaxID=2661917 RepID=UPI00193383F4|nr:rod shape-determining protein RodA [Anaerococcus sp. mt242]MBM0046388.1 rod shape-determining protein RodA [Anaerococcus sp. mt242]
MFNIKKKNLKDLDLILLFATLILSIYGLVILYSAYGGDFDSIKMQIASTLLGFVLIGIFCTIDLEVLKRFYLWIYGIGLGLLILTLIFGRGLDEWGAKSWVYIGSFSFQPSEFVKVGLIFAFAAYLDQNKYQINEPKKLIQALIFVAVPVGLILLQPDFGTAMVFLFFIAAMLFVAGLSWKWILFFAVGGITVGYLVLSNLSGYRADRIQNFLDPARDTSGSNWQQQQGMIAIGSGMLKGRGYLNGTQSQYGYVPEKETDFIFSVLAEELGFIGAILLVLLFTIIILRLARLAKKSNNTFISLMVTGIAAMLFIHIFENIGMTIGLMPVTGIPLPFLSAGGTFQLICLIMIGLALSASMQKSYKDDDILDYETIKVIDPNKIRTSKKREIKNTATN